METAINNNQRSGWTVVGWLFCAIFAILGVLNAILVHVVPGAFYLVLAIVYYPQTNKFLKNRLGFSIPEMLKLIFGLLVLWATLAVGDLMELFEAWVLR